MEGSGTSDEFVVFVGVEAPEDPDVAEDPEELGVPEDPEVVGGGSISGPGPVSGSRTVWVGPKNPPLDSAAKSEALGCCSYRKMPNWSAEMI